MIKIVGYGLGNVQALLNVYKKLGIPASIAVNPSELYDAKRIILPGVGSFDYAIELLERSGMRHTLEECVLSRHIPVLGICVGMQILGTMSEEGQKKGLNWIPGSVRKLKLVDHGTQQKLRLPHMGWNDVMPLGSSPLFRGLEEKARFYFLHSYYFDCQSRHSVLAQSDYGVQFPCAVYSGNVYGVQFHPEKSHDYGLQLLKNFAEI